MSLALVSPSITSAADQAQGRAQNDGQIDAGDRLHQVVSVVKRDSTSPTRVVSKNIGSMRTTRRYTAVRRSATTRSPSQVTR